MWQLILEMSTFLLIVVVAGLQIAMLRSMAILTRKSDQDKARETAIQDMKMKLEEYQKQINAMNLENGLQKERVEMILSISRRGTPVFTEKASDDVDI